MLSEILTAALITAVVITLILLLRKWLLMPVPFGRSTEPCLCLKITGAEPMLEATVKGLDALRRDGALRSEILIEDAGMDDETRYAAYILSRERGYITLTRSEEKAEWETTPGT